MNTGTRLEDEDRLVISAHVLPEVLGRTARWTHQPIFLGNGVRGNRADEFASLVSRSQHKQVRRTSLLNRRHNNLLSVQEF
jgi:hypothetical protein